MSTIKLYHYVYRITNVIENKHYYGKRSSKIDPKLDLGIKYFSSSKDKEFIQDQKINPQNYKYKFVSYYSTLEEAISKEIKLHNKFNVGINPKFYNRAKQTSIKFDTTGQISWNLGKTHTKETKEKMSKAQIGKMHTKETKLKISKATTGINNPRAKFANIYNYTTNEVIAKNVIIKIWAKEKLNVDGSGLHKTAKADKTKLSSTINPHSYKNMYVVYLN